MTSPIPAIPDPPRRTVHFSQGGIAGGGATPAASAALIPSFLLGGAALAFSGYLALARFPWMPLAVRATLVSVLFLVALVLLFRLAARGYMRVMNALKMPMEMDPRADVNVICWPDQMARLSPLIPPEGDTGAFEPEAARVWVSRRTSLASRLQTRRQRFRYGMTVAAFVVVLQIVIHTAVRGWIDPTGIFAVVGLALLVPIVWGFARPTFLRIAPGRVDIVRFGWFGGRPSIETHDLRSRPVRLDCRRKELLIGGWHASQPDAEPAEGDDPPADETDEIQRNWDKYSQYPNDPQASMGTPHQVRSLTIIPFWASVDAGAIEQALFRATVSTATPAPLPDDDLFG